MEKVRQHAFRISQHIIVPLSHDLKSFSAKQFVACPISHRSAVLTSIDFGDHLPLEADKIEDVVLEWGLSAKLDTVQMAIAEQEPEFSFGIGGDTSHCARMLAQPHFDRLMMWRF